MVLIAQAEEASLEPVQDILCGWVWRGVDHAELLELGIKVLGAARVRLAV